MTVMKNGILCSSNPILIKSLYGMLRDEGLSVETMEHPAFAVQMIMKNHYDFLIIDSEPFGLSAEDAAEIILSIAPDMKIMFLGKNRSDRPGETAAAVDLAEIKRTIHGIVMQTA
jgi:DNA-binding NtrC family response regulator